MSTFKRKFLFPIFSILIGLFFCLIIAEMVIRIDNAMDNKRRKIYIPHPFLGYVHSSNNRFRWTDDVNQEFSHEHTTDRYGFINTQVVYPKQPGVTRILILGDSFTEALQVNAEENFCARLEAMLNGKEGMATRTFEVINAGVSASSPINYYLNYKRVLKDLDADLVMVQLWTNDVF